MSQLVKTKRQANFKDFKDFNRFGARRTKKQVRETSVLNWPTHAIKTPIFSAVCTAEQSEFFTLSGLVYNRHY
jgi:hypothetical protein